MSASVVHGGWRKHRWQSIGVGLIAALAAAAACGGERSEPTSTVAHTVPAMDSDQKLQQMSETLARAGKLTFTAVRHLDAALVEGINVAESTDIEVAVSRPHMLWARMVSDAGVRRFYADGRNMSLLDEEMKLYASVPLSGTIDQVVDTLDLRFGFTPPVAEFVLNDPYRRFRSQMQQSIDEGTETVSGELCDHLFISGAIANADLWLSAFDHLPRRFIATFKDREPRPQLRIDFSDWNLAADLQDSLFLFVPPGDAERVDMVVTEDVGTGAAKRVRATENTR